MTNPPTASRPSDSKQAEKAYLRRAAAGAWERTKPFSPPGSDTIEESAHLIHDFAVALQTLRLSPRDRVLDLGAGPCWCAEWLTRLNVPTVAVDISLDMLAVGRSRMHGNGPARLVAGDMEALPFADGSFDKAVCLNALHHVPDIDTALGEIARVLNGRGAVLFSEPGQGHARMPGSVTAMRDFGVLEQDIVIARFMEGCYRAGFTDVRLKPMAYVIPGFDLTLDQWQAWQRFWRRKRPWRATQKFWRALLELVGAGKRGPLLEETFAVNVVRLLKQPVEKHPIIVAYKGPAEAPVEEVVYGARIEVVEAPDQVPRGGPIRARLCLANIGTVTWQPGETTGCVRIGIQLLDADRKLIDRDYHRAALPEPIDPGRSIELAIEYCAPSISGLYHLKLDLVTEGITWFEPRGSTAITHRLIVEG